MSKQVACKCERCQHTAMGIKAVGLTGYLRDQAEAWAGIGDPDQAGYYAALLDAVEELMLAGNAAATLVQQARQVMQDFVDSCDRGEARSVRTYAACRRWLAAWAGAALADAKLEDAGARDRYGIAETETEEATK